jgi:hypothetical protein
LKVNYAFLYISGFNIILSSTMSLVCTTELHINTSKKQFQYPLYIRGICHTYTAAMHIHGTYMVYTDYIPCWGSR